MGVVDNVRADRWPKQGPSLSRRVTVMFNYDTSQRFCGTIVRDDYEEPWRTIICLDNGHVVLSTECQWSFA